METQSHQVAWWDGEAYRWVRDDISHQFQAHARRIENAKLDTDKNAQQLQPNPRRTLHNAETIQNQLNVIQNRFRRWERTFAANGDINRWQQIPGAYHWATFDWTAILPDIHSAVYTFTIPSHQLNLSHSVGNNSAVGHSITGPGHTTNLTQAPGALPGNFQPPGASPGPTNSGSFQPPAASPGHADYGNFQYPGAFHGPTNSGHFQPQAPGAFHGFTNYGSFQPLGAFPGPINSDHFQTQGTFHAGTPGGHDTFQPYAYFPTNGNVVHDAPAPQGAFLHSGSDRADQDAFQPAWKECLPTTVPDDHRLPEPAKSLPPRDTIGHQAIEPTASSTLNMIDGPTRCAHSAPCGTPTGQTASEPTRPVLTHARAEQRSSGHTASKPQAASKRHILKQLLAVLDLIDYFGDHDRESGDTRDARNQPSTPKSRESTARRFSMTNPPPKPSTKRRRSPSLGEDAGHFFAASPPPKPFAKRRRSPSLGEDAGHGAKHINIRGYKKQSP